MVETISSPIGDKILSAFLDRLQDQFAAMDRAYVRSAAHYRFKCDRCMDNCCLTRFHHHTYLEYYYLRRGLDSLDSSEKASILEKAQAVVRATAEADDSGGPVRLMCPLNDESLCALYLFRPMICRLHGIPHELQKPGYRAIQVPGCSTFDERCAGKQYVKFDRTPFYAALAELENEFKQAAGLEGRIKMTVAEMILSIAQNSEDR